MTKRAIWTTVAVISVSLLGYFLLRQPIRPSEKTNTPNAEGRLTSGTQESVAAGLQVASDPRAVLNAPQASVPFNKTPAQRYRNGDRLAQLHAELTNGAGASPSSQYLARKIVFQCGLTAGTDETTFVPRNENTRAMALAMLRKQKESCAGLDTTLAALRRTTEQKTLALASGDPVAAAEDMVTFVGQGLTADAFVMNKGRLKQFPDNPDVWEPAIGLLPAMGIPIGGGDDLLKKYSPEQMLAATMLAACERTSSCTLNDSIFLQGQCIHGGLCSNSLFEYFQEHGLPPAAMAGLPAATTRLSELITQGRWDLIGYAPGNQPVQKLPRVLPPPPGK